MSTWLQDLKYGLRIVTKDRLFSFVVVLTIALAIGANTVIFSFANVFLIRPLPLREPDGLGWIFTIDPQRGGERAPVSIPDFLDFRQSARSFQSLAATTQGTYTMTGRGDALRLAAIRVTANLLDVWGLPLMLGRGFHAGEDAPGAAPVVVLSHHFWQREFQGNPSIVGDTLMLDGVSHTVIGVLTPAIEIGNLSLIEIWTPLTIDPNARRDERVIRVSGRLDPGTTLDTANGEIRMLASRLAEVHPTTNSGWSARVAPTREMMAGDDAWTTLALLGLVATFVLLIACANLANLMLARGAERRKEIALRSALGAGRVRLIRQLIAENLAFGVVGGALGILLAYGGLLIVKSAAYEPFFELVTIDSTVLLFAGVVSLATPLLFSLLPALHGSRADLTHSLKESASRTTAGGRTERSRAALVVSQVALASMLLVVAGLLIRSLEATAAIDVGFNQKGLLSFRVDLPEQRYPGDPQVRQFYDRMLPALRVIPGAEAVSAVNRLPVLGGEVTTAVSIQGRPAGTPKDQPWAVHVTASDDYFRTAGIPLVLGRVLESRDMASSAPVAVINREMARRYWVRPEHAIGQRISATASDAQPRWVEIVGVVGDVRPPDVTLKPNPQLYVPLAQNPQRSAAFLIRAANPESLSASVREVARRVDSEVALYQLRTVEEGFNDEISSTKILIGLFAAFAIVAVSLAAAGLYAVTSYAVSQRVREIGIRVALGAADGDIRRLVLGGAVRLILAGAAIGTGGSLLLGRTMTSLLYGVGPADPSTFAGVLLLLSGVALAASYIPARRAMRMDPIQALRLE